MGESTTRVGVGGLARVSPLMEVGVHGCVYYEYGAMGESTMGMRDG